MKRDGQRVELTSGSPGARRAPRAARDRAQMAVGMRVLANRAVRARLDDLARRAEREHAAVEHEQAVEPVVDAIEIVRRHQHRQPAADELAHDLAQRFFRRRVDAGRRFVEQQQLRAPARSRGRRRRAAAGRRRAARCAGPRVRSMPTTRERLDDRFAIVRAEALPKVQARKTPHRDDVPDGRRERPVHRFDLRHVGDRSRAGVSAASDPSTQSSPLDGRQAVRRSF